MLNIFVRIHEFLLLRKKWFYFLFLLLLIYVGYNISKIKLQEDITALIPNDEGTKEMQDVFKGFKLADQLIFIFSVKDTSVIDPEQLIVDAEKITDRLGQDTLHVRSIRFKSDLQDFYNVYDFIYNHLPLYLTKNDYKEIQAQLDSSAIERTMRKNFMTLISPTGFGAKAYIYKDPLSIVPKALKRLQEFQLDDNFIIYNSCVFTKDKRHLLVFVEPKFPASNTDENKNLISTIEQIIKSESISSNLNYYGGTAVAVANAQQIKKDILLTIIITFITLILFFVFTFSNVKTIFLLFLPIILGSFISLGFMAFYLGEVSSIALGVGTILLGIAVDYSLYFFTYLRSSGSVYTTISDISQPILMGFMTTVVAFLCLLFVRSPALQQLGLFAAVSVFATGFIVLIVLPLIISDLKIDKLTLTSRKTFFDVIAQWPYDKSKWLLLLICILSIVFIFTAQNVKMNSDIATLNYMPQKLAESEMILQSVSSQTQSAVFIVTNGINLNEALRKMDKLTTIFDTCRDEKLASSIASASDLIFSEEVQRERIYVWQEFWTKNKKDDIINIVIVAGSNNHFKDSAFNSFYGLLNKDFCVMPSDSFGIMRRVFLSNYIHQNDSVISVASVLKVKKENKEKLFAKFDKNDDAVIIDKQYFVNHFLIILNQDFSKLVNYSMLFVFLFMLLFFGRIEIASITMIPVILSWLWTTGLMGIFHQEFNIFNIIISTFIFGLGVDYSILIMSAMLSNYKFGEHSIIPYRLSVLFSVFTTIAGVGVLIFAKHPALRSIAFFSIFGLLSLVLISYTILPRLFRFLTLVDGKRRVEPINLPNLLISFFSFFVFLAGAIILTLLIPVLVILPLNSKNTKALFSYLIYLFAKFIVAINITIKKTHIDKSVLDFKKPSILISNHQSHLDLVLILMQNPKIIVLTNKWVWNNPFYGFVVKYADFYPIYKGIEDGYQKIRDKIADGYSVLVFPEGKRTIDGEIKRFHQGALHLADVMGLDIQPIMIHGAFECLPKTDYFLKSGQITIKFFNRITVRSGNLLNGISYKAQATEITHFYRFEYINLKNIVETTNFYSRRLLSQYIYKGPVLEWYLRIKLGLEKNYSFYNEHIPKDAIITDLGCGYGFLAYMLKYTSSKRNIIGIDYDEKKVAIAQNIVNDIDGIRFIVKDISIDTLPISDVYILNDVLHYLPKDKQVLLLNQCINNIGINGMIFIRDADADLIKRTKGTKFTEFQSTQLFGFNKTKHELTYISGSIIRNLAISKGLECKVYDHAKMTSNISYVLTKPANGKI